MKRIETALIRLAAALCKGEDKLIRDCIQRALAAGATATQLREVIHTSYLFDGYPTALEGFRILGELTTVQRVPRGEFSYTGDSVKRWRARGERLSRKIYGPQFESLVERVRQMAPELADAMMVEGYGKVLSRPGLEPALRELCVVAILAAKNRPRQLLSHSLGALRLGVNPERLRTLPGILEGVALKGNLLRAVKIINDAISRYATP